MQIPTDGHMKILIFYNSWLQLIASTVDEALEFLRNTENSADYRIVYWTPYRIKTTGDIFLELGGQYGRYTSRTV